MSEHKKGDIQEKINTLTAKNNVLKWKGSHGGKPTVEDYETQKTYYDTQKQFAQDELVNGIGSGKLKPGTDEWYALQDKINGLEEEQSKAYNMGMMGQLDGERAVSAEEQAAANVPRTGGGYRGGMSFSADNDAPMYVGMDDEEQEETTQGNVQEDDKNIFDVLDDIFSGKWITDAVTGTKEWVNDNRHTIEKWNEAIKWANENDGGLKEWLDLKKQSIDDTFYALVDMSYEDKEVFVNTDTAIDYFGDIEFLKNRLTPEEIAKYQLVLFGDTNRYFVHNGQIMLTTHDSPYYINSTYWDTHMKPDVKPKDFNEEDTPNLGDAPFNPWVLEQFNLTPEDFIQQEIINEEINEEPDNEEIVDITVDEEFGSGEGQAEDSNNSNSEFGEAFVNAALEYLGESYFKEDGKTHHVDCSMLVKKALSDCGFKIGGSSNGLAKQLDEMGYSIPIVGEYNYDKGRFDIDESTLQSGDLLFYRLNNSREGEGFEVTHVAIYVGDGKILHSTPRGNGVYIEDGRHDENWGLGQGYDEVTYDNKGNPIPPYTEEPILRLIVRIPKQ